MCQQTLFRFESLPTDLAIPGGLLSSMDSFHLHHILEVELFDMSLEKGLYFELLPAEIARRDHHPLLFLMDPSMLFKGSRPLKPFPAELAREFEQFRVRLELVAVEVIPAQETLSAPAAFGRDHGYFRVQRAYCLVTFTLADVTELFEAEGAREANVLMGHVNMIVELVVGGEDLETEFALVSRQPLWFPVRSGIEMLGSVVSLAVT